jgi:hypothetical protein
MKRQVADAYLVYPRVDTFDSYFCGGFEYMVREREDDKASGSFLVD